MSRNYFRPNRPGSRLPRESAPQGWSYRNEWSDSVVSNTHLNEFAERLAVSPAYWSRVEREQENPPRDDLVERVAAILEVKLDDLFCEAGRLPPDLRGDIKAVVTLYRRDHDIAKASNKS
ncbi:MAG: helix-turn-helix domain-containing protein [Aestuariivirga sp.]